MRGARGRVVGGPRWRASGWGYGSCPTRRADRFRGGAPFMEGPCLATLAGRGVWEKVTAPATLRASAGPTPRTRWNPSIEPKGPLESRSTTILAASAGPMPGSDSSWAAVARSRSRGAVRGAGGVEVAALVRGRGRGEPPGERGRARFDSSALRAESTATSWAPSPRSSAGRSSAGFRHARAPVPRTATAEKKSRTLRSAGVTLRQEAKDASAAERTTALVCASHHVIA